MNRQKAISLICFILIAGCATSTLKEGLPYLVGRSFDDAVGVLGLPDASMQLGENTVYVWGTNVNFSMPTTTYNTSTTTGSVGSTPIYGTTTTASTSYVPINYNCTIKLSVNSANRVVYWEFNGNEGGCAAYAGKVKRLIPED